MGKKLHARKTDLQNHTDFFVRYVKLVVGLTAGGE